jgi:DNA polymerase I-like protein with 3'-5' exonuclease and polymerase domains
LDGRFIPCPADFKALNYLIQSSTSIVGKLWATQAVERLKAANVPCDLVMYVHDELQFDCSPAHVEYASEVIKRSLSDACSFYGLTVKMTCDTQTGRDWSESH